MSDGLRVAVVGATGAVGRELLGLLEERRFPVRELIPLASARSAGTVLPFLGGGVAVREASSEALKGADVAFFSAGAETSRALARESAERGTLVVDNSSAFRMAEDVPLVVPEVNFEAIQPENSLIANPNCTAIIMLMAVAPLRRLGTIRRIVASTYQSASGAGAAAMQELLDQTRAALEGRNLVPKVMPHPYAFNLFSHNTPLDENGWNGEEAKVAQEARKILGDPGLLMNVTCVRVPVLRAHAESITVEFEGEAPSEEAVREVLAQAPGVRLVDERSANHFPMPNEASGQGDVLVGRIRKDLSHPSGLCLFVAGDQLLKGAALNAMQIAERLLTRFAVTADI